MIHLAAAHGRADAMKERLLRAYFTEGELIADHETLVRMASEVGISKLETRTVLAGKRYADAVRADEAIAQQLGIAAVPTFVVNRKLAMSGANPPDQLLALLRQGWEQGDAGAVVDAGAACGPTAADRRAGKVTVLQGRKHSRFEHALARFGSLGVAERLEPGEHRVEPELEPFGSPWPVICGRTRAIAGNRSGGRLSMNTCRSAQ